MSQRTAAIVAIVGALFTLPNSLQAQRNTANPKANQSTPQNPSTTGRSTTGQPSTAAYGSPSTPTVTPENPEAAGKARRYFRKGLEKFEARLFRDAIRDFELAGQAVPSADLWYNIARSHEELNEIPQAIEHYRKYLRNRVDPPDRKQIEAHIAELEERAVATRRAQKRKKASKGVLRISGIADEATVQVDGQSPKLGKEVVMTADGAESTVPEDEEGAEQTPGAQRRTLRMTLKSGDHALRIDEAGYVPFRAMTRVEAGVTTVAYPDMLPATQYRAKRGKPRWTWLVASLAVAALATSLGLGIHAARSDGDDQRQFSRYSDYSLGAGLGLGVATAITYFIERRTVETQRMVGPMPSSLTPQAGQ